MKIGIANKPTAICGDHDAADLHRAEAALRMAASPEPDVAAHGRFQRDVVPAFYRWCEAEIARDNLAASSQGLVYGIANILLSWTGGLAGPRAVEFSKDLLLAIGDCVAAAEKAGVTAIIEAAHAKRRATR